MRAVCLALLVAAGAAAQMRVVDKPGKSPVVTFRVVFTTGAAYDPEAKPGVANLTAMMLSQGGSREMTYQQIVDALFPMAATVASQVDKEMTTFSGATHVDNLDAYYKLFRAMLLEPGWREDDFKRLKDNAVNYLKVTLRGNNDEELGKEELYNQIYAGTTYGRENVGTISALEAITLDDLKDFYRKHYTQTNLIIGIAGGYTPQFLERMKADFRDRLPAKGLSGAAVAPEKPLTRTRMTIVDKGTRSVAYSIGFPLSVKRGDPDYPALLVANAWFGQHRTSGGRLFQRMREVRGLNYGDYSYIEYFPRGMFVFEPSPNLARQRQIFQIWVRPVEPNTAGFALRLAVFELNRLVKEGLTQEEFDRTRAFVSKYVNLLMKSKRAELGYDIDSMYYGIPSYDKYVKAQLAKLTRDGVNRAIRRNLHADKLQIVAVSKNAQALKDLLAGGQPTPMSYNSPKAAEIAAEDKMVEKWDLGLRPEDIAVVPVERVFE